MSAATHSSLSERAYLHRLLQHPSDTWELSAYPEQLHCHMGWDMSAPCRDQTASHLCSAKSQCGATGCPRMPDGCPVCTHVSKPQSPATTNMMLTSRARQSLPVQGIVVQVLVYTTHGNLGCREVKARTPSIPNIELCREGGNRSSG